MSSPPAGITGPGDSGRTALLTFPMRGGRRVSREVGVAVAGRVPLRPVRGAARTDEAVAGRTGRVALACDAAERVVFADAVRGAALDAARTGPALGPRAGARVVGAAAVVEAGRLGAVAAVRAMDDVVGRLTVGRTPLVVAGRGAEREVVAAAADLLAVLPTPAPAARRGARAGGSFAFGC
jgi:hypothetical protein